MINSEWNDFFGIEEVYDTSDLLETSFDGAKKDAVAALASCINTNGCVDIKWMMKVTGLSFAALKEALTGAIYQDPKEYDLHRDEYVGWMLRAQYLSGNIMDKLKFAKKMTGKYRGRFDANVQVLKSIMPNRLDFDAIGFGIGSPWIPEYFYSDFAKEILGLYYEPEIRYSKELGRWHIADRGRAKNFIHNIYTYGTRRMPALQIIEATLNGSTVKIYDEVVRTDRKSGVARVLNKVETLAAQEKQEILQNAFQEWVRKSPHRMKRLVDIFYETYSCNVSGRFSGGFLTLPGLNTKEFSPYPHQKDAVARIILEKDVLLNHRVGTGKTGIIIMGIHERKRIGLSDKNLVVVPNNVLEAFERTHRQLYPQDNILVVHPEDFRPGSRQAFLERIRDAEYTAVYMAFSSFEKLDMSREYKLKQQKQRIIDCRVKAAAAAESWEKNSLEASAKRLEKELKKMEEELPADEYIPFDKLRITTLVVDEAHNFKNVSLNAQADGIVGMHVSGSKKCNEMMEKVQFVRRQGGGIIFSTGTPLTNSVSDLFVLQLFLQPEQLEFLRLDRFDEWINNFATRQTGFEVDVDSQSYRIMTRFSSFHNVPELTSLFAGVCDFYRSDDKDMNLPESEEYKDIVVPKSPEQSEYIDDLVVRTEMIRQKLVTGTEDNLLKVTHDGRAAALDIRLAEPNRTPELRTTKIYACAQNVYMYWKEYPGTAQLVFCDLGTPKKGFNVYDELNRLLTDMGIPDKEIAYVHNATTDAKRRKLFNAVNKAEIRVLIGSTSKLGIGVNVQEHLIAIHHLDIPWRPSDIIQREGRLIRQGNTNDRVFRFRYITAGTFDAYSWQLLENKQRFISQFMDNSLISRDVRDINDDVLSYAEIKALSVGDPLLKDRIDTANELERTKICSKSREKELRNMETVVKETSVVLNRMSRKKQQIRKDWRRYSAQHRGLRKDERTSFGEELLEALTGNVLQTSERLFDELYGFRVLLPMHMTAERPYLLLEGPSGIRYEIDMRDAKVGGCIQRIEHVLSHLPDRVRKIDDEIKRAKEQCAQAQNELRKGNPYTKEISRISAKLLSIDAELNRRANEDIA